MNSAAVGFSLIATTRSMKLLELIVLILFSIILYLIYKFIYPRDFGVPVRRRLLTVHMRVIKDQIAFVPFWWSDIQVQRAVNIHWKKSMRESATLPDEPQSSGSSATATAPAEEH